MVMRRFTTSAAMLALVAGIGTGAMAQTAPASNDLPAPLAALNLNNLEIDTKRDGMRDIEGRSEPVSNQASNIEIRLDRVLP